MENRSKKNDLRDIKKFSLKLNSSVKNNPIIIEKIFSKIVSGVKKSNSYSLETDMAKITYRQKDNDLEYLEVLNQIVDTLTVSTYRKKKNDDGSLYLTTVVQTYSDKLGHLVEEENISRYVVFKTETVRKQRKVIRAYDICNNLVSETIYDYDDVSYPFSDTNIKWPDFMDKEAIKTVKKDLAGDEIIIQIKVDEKPIQIFKGVHDKSKKQSLKIVPETKESITLNQKTKIFE